MSLPGFGAFVAVMVVEMTLGKTLANVAGCTKSGAYACAACKLLQLFLAAAVADRGWRIGLTHLLHFGACFLMASAPLPPMARKLGLSMFPLLLVNRLPLSSSSSSSTSSSSSSSSGGGRIPANDTADMQLLATTLVGCAAALVAVGLLPWPSLATLRENLRQATEAKEELLNIFDRIDTDGSGVLTSEELLTFCTGLR